MNHDVYIYIIFGFAAMNNHASLDYILNKKIEDGRILYLVKWTGKQHTKNSWMSTKQISKMGGKNLL